ncbi:hypothetical protein [Streptomyces tagetis]|uniref:Secreted protein n=1 Tax=Streptomyces tagetis TaxID=2820809 RepID=A0A941B4B3_9ACTN|nr:hypothetical protein [Streptomyces sp. RG38]MBQ0829047.1 hypothetical protein [Streptomyces sp. RG38]
MAAIRRRRLRHATLAAVAALLTASAATGCDAVGRTVDCVQSADAIADGVTELQQAVETASEDPARLDAALDAIERDLGEIGEHTGNAGNAEKAQHTDVDRAAGHLEEAVGNVRAAVRKGDTTPDLTPVTAAAGELTKACTP